MLSRGDYHWQHEPCWYAVRKSGKGHWAGDRKQTTLWHIASRDQDAETVHGTQKPVEAMRRPMLNNSSPGQAVYDPFMGSGTTLIAAETTGRVCLGLELNPVYVDVAVERWQLFTGRRRSSRATDADSSRCWRAGGPHSGTTRSRDDVEFGAGSAWATGILSNHQLSEEDRFGPGEGARLLRHDARGAAAGVAVAHRRSGASPVPKESSTTLWSVAVASHFLPAPNLPDGSLTALYIGTTHILDRWAWDGEKPAPLIHDAEIIAGERGQQNVDAFD